MNNCFQKAEDAVSQNKRTYCFYDILILERAGFVSLELKCYSQKTEYQKVGGVGTNVGYNFKIWAEFVWVPPPYSLLPHPTVHP